MLDLARLDRVLHVDELERYVVTQPGVVNDDLRRAVAAHGLWYPPDPASSPWSTIGGNIATNAGGVCCVKYGVTRDYVLELEVVTGSRRDRAARPPDGEGRRGLRPRRARRRLRGHARHRHRGRVAPAPAADRRRAPSPATSTPSSPRGEAVTAVAAAGLTPSALELVDRHCLAAVDAWKNMGLSADAEVVLLGQVDTAGAAGDAEAGLMRDCFDGAGATWAAVSSDPAEAEALMAARRLAYPALERLGPVLTEDICVPKAAVPTMLAAIERIAARTGTTIANIAHAGDGNLHPLLITPRGRPAARAGAQQAFTEIIAEALRLGGTVTGEHGVGLLKRDGMARELSPAVLDMHRAVKRALDPHGILNPGKAVPDAPLPG